MSEPTAWRLADERQCAQPAAGHVDGGKEVERSTMVVPPRHPGVDLILLTRCPRVLAHAAERRRAPRETTTRRALRSASVRLGSEGRHFYLHSDEPPR